MPNSSNVAAYFAGTVWALDPAKYEQILAVVERIGADGFRADAPQQWAEWHGSPVTVNDRGIATVPVEGTISRKANMFMRASGGTSSEILGNTVRALADDPNVRGILLRVNSPGGSVDGIDALRGAVEYAAGRKPTHALADSAALSLGYWLASSATKVHATADALLGSIGVISSRVDMSEKLEKEGIKAHIFRSGSLKALGNSSEPLTDAETAETMRILGNYHNLFAEHVATRRGISVEDVNNTNSAVFSPQEALDLQLIDSMKTYDEVLAELDAAATAEERIAALSGELAAGATELATLAQANEQTAAKLAAVEADLASLRVADTEKRIDAAVKTLIAEDQKVLPAMEADLRTRLGADYDGTLAAFALVPKGAAAPANGTVAQSAAAPDEITAALARGVYVAETKAAAEVYAEAKIEHIDKSGDNPRLVSYSK